jgi:2,4-dienoyl-CoA reductase-like NADH-dependent reductase (Old Yellow Enzyme family)
VNPLLTSLRLGALTLPNRIIMAPLTRSRSDPGGQPTALNACYYAQRASAGAIVSEAADVAPESAGFDRGPGLYSDAQVAGWRTIVDAVHASQGRILLQLHHAGRVSSEAVSGQQPVAPSELTDDTDQLQAWGMLANGRISRVLVGRPRALSIDDLDRVVRDYGAAARRAREAGADGIEIHAGHGYLLHQFLSSGTNRRTDQYGGSPAARLRLLERVLDAVLAEFRADRVGVRVSPFAIYNHPADTEQDRTYPLLAALLQRLGVSYLHVSDLNAVWGLPPDLERAVELVRPAYDGPIVGAGGISPTAAAELVERRVVDAVAFGRAYIANPDLVERIAAGGPYNELRQDLWHSGFYGGGAVGYTDYPRLDGGEAGPR